MKNNSPSIGSAEELLAELRHLVVEAERLLSNSVSEQTAETLDALRARFDAAQERLSHLYVDARDKVVAGAKRTDETIRSHPYESLAVAAGIGALLGVLLSRRCR